MTRKVVEPASVVGRATMLTVHEDIVRAVSFHGPVKLVHPAVVAVNGIIDISINGSKTLVTIVYVGKNIGMHGLKIIIGLGFTVHSGPTSIVGLPTA